MIPSLTELKDNYNTYWVTYILFSWSFYWICQILNLPNFLLLIVIIFGLSLYWIKLQIDGVSSFKELNLKPVFYHTARFLGYFVFTTLFYNHIWFLYKDVLLAINPEQITEAFFGQLYSRVIYALAWLVGTYSKLDELHGIHQISIFNKVLGTTSSKINLRLCVLLFIGVLINILTWLNIIPMFITLSFWATMPEKLRRYIITKILKWKNLSYEKHQELLKKESNQFWVDLEEEKEALNLVISSWSNNKAKVTWTVFKRRLEISWVLWLLYFVGCIIAFPLACLATYNVLTLWELLSFKNWK